MRVRAAFLLLFAGWCPLAAENLRVYPAGERPADSRLEELRTLNGYFPFRPVEDKSQWDVRQAEIKRRILISQGLWPEPTKTALQAVVHGRMDFDDYTVEKVYFQSLPGHFVTGSLYRPKGKTGPFPAVLCPHGHWADARFYDAGELAAKRLIASGAERFVNAARNHIQARCVQLARMGCIAFFYDTTGNSDSIQIGHRPDQSDHLDTKTHWGFFSVQAELRLQNMMGLQTWNSIRSVDFVLGLPDVDSTRIGVTGASGGGTQSMILAAVDDRIAAAMPCVMVSTSMQGGCTCENAALMRIDQGNIDIAAAIAPRPLGLTAADDWTKELETKGYPDLQNLYAMLGHRDRLTAVFHTHFPHNYNHVNRTVMYDFFNRHFKLGLEEPVLERDFPLLSKEQSTVWNDKHPAPSGSRVGDPHEMTIIEIATEDSRQKIADLVPTAPAGLDEFRSIIGKAWETILGRRLDQVGDVTLTETTRTMAGDVLVTLGRLSQSTAKEELPAMTLVRGKPAGPSVVVWITANGKAGVLQDDQVIAPVAGMLDKGFIVIAADLIGQGEFTADGRSWTSQRMWHQRKAEATWERFSGYTFGYNHSLFVQRVHDVLALVRYAQTLAGSQKIHLVGLDGVAGPIVLAARSQAAESVAETIVDVDGFRFETLTKHDDPMFVPGSVRYLDVDGLISLNAPHRVAAAGAGSAEVAKRVYAAAESADRLRLVGREQLEAVLNELQ
ncbi:MAG: acetylxylan esterase [Planctomycetaceae bacterium]